MFYLGGIGLAVFLNVLLLSKRKKTVADKILTAWLLIITTPSSLVLFRENVAVPATIGY